MVVCIRKQTQTNTANERIFYDAARSNNTPYTGTSFHLVVFLLLSLKTHSVPDDIIQQQQQQQHTGMIKMIDRYTPMHRKVSR